MSLKIDAAVYSHIGGRANNEDNFYFNGVYMDRDQMNRGGQAHAVCGDSVQVYAVCDGMGGAEFGEEASLRTVTELAAYQKSCSQPDSTVHLNRMIDSVSRKVDEISVSRGMASGSSGSTIAMFIANDYYYRIAHVGDSRLYRMRAGRLERLSRDHSEVQQLLDAGQITEAQAWRHPKGNVITKHLGMPIEPGAELQPTVSVRQDLAVGDRFLICSDGLTDVVPDAQIQKLLEACPAPVQAAQTLVREALRGAEYYGVSSDNVTVMVLDIKSVGGRAQLKRRAKLLRLAQCGSAVLAALSAGGIGYMCWRLFFNR